MRTRDSRTREQTCLQTCRLAQPQCIHDTRITLHLKLKSYRNSKNANPTLSSLNHWPLLRLFRRGTSTFPPPARLHSPERLRSARRHRPRRADVAHVMPVLRQEGCCAQSHSRWGERMESGDEAETSVSTMEAAKRTGSNTSPDQLRSSGSLQYRSMCEPVCTQAKSTKKGH